MPLDPAVAATRLAVRRDLPLLPDGKGGLRSPHVRDGGTVLVACSGGADSLALLAATVFEARTARFRVVGVTVDHALQQGSAEHSARVVAQMAALGVDETAGIRVTVDAGPGGVEAGAREARYAALGQLAEHFGADVVLLGHTRDDQAETVLLGLTRGSGGRSIAGMRRGFDGFSRPLLDLTRAQTEQACRAQGIEWWSDPHNVDPRFVRSRIRHTVLPMLEEQLGPGIAAALARTAELLRPDMEALDDLAARALDDAADETDDAYRTGPLESLPWALTTRVLRLAAIEAGAIASELTYQHVLAVSDLVLGHESTVRTKQVQLPGHLTAHREGGLLRFRRTTVPG